MLFAGDSPDFTIASATSVGAQTSIGIDGQNEAEQRIEQAQRSSETTLSLHGLQLTSVPNSIGNLPQLTKLALDQNLLTELSPRICQLGCLTRLSLHRNRFETLPVEICLLVNLEELDVYRCNLHVLPPQIGSLVRLTRLWLHNNKLFRLPPEVGSLTNLKELRISDNQLLSVPAELGRLTNLVRLSLAGNQLCTLPYELCHLTKLAWFTCHGNPWNGSHRPHLWSSPWFDEERIRKILRIIATINPPTTIIASPTAPTAKPTLIAPASSSPSPSSLLTPPSTTTTTAAASTTSTSSTSKRTQTLLTSLQPSPAPVSSTTAAMAKAAKQFDLENVPDHLRNSDVELGDSASDDRLPQRGLITRLIRWLSQCRKRVMFSIVSVFLFILAATTVLFAVQSSDVEGQGTGIGQSGHSHTSTAYLWWQSFVHLEVADNNADGSNREKANGDESDGNNILSNGSNGKDGATANHERKRGEGSVALLPAKDRLHSSFAPSDRAISIHIFNEQQKGDARRTGERLALTESTCKNTKQGSLFVTDDLGYLCSRDQLDGERPGCCIRAQSARFVCKNCQRHRNGTLTCCTSFEDCVSCCMDPDNLPVLEKTLGFQAKLTSLMFPQHRFRVCDAVCRTSSASMIREKAYLCPDHRFCYDLVLAIRDLKALDAWST